MVWQAYFLQAAAGEVVEDLPCPEEEEGEEAAEEASWSSMVKLIARCVEWKKENPDAREAGELGRT